MSTTKGAPSSRSFISFTVSPESARFCNCCSTVCLVERTLALLLLLFPLSPHQILASLKSLLLLFTGFIGLEVRGWCEAAMLTLSVITLSSLCTHVTSSASVSQLSLSGSCDHWASVLPAQHRMRDGPGSDGGCSNTRHHQHGWKLHGRNYLMHLQKRILQEQIVNCSAERSAPLDWKDVTAQSSDEWRIVEESRDIHHSWK